LPAVANDECNLLTMPQSVISAKENPLFRQMAEAQPVISYYFVEMAKILLQSERETIFKTQYFLFITKEKARCFS